MIGFIFSVIAGLAVLSIVITVVSKIFALINKILAPVFDFIRPAVEFIFGLIFVIAIICFILSLIIPDPVPVVDEIFFGGASLGSYTIVKIYD